MNNFDNIELEIINALNLVTKEAYIDKTLKGDANWTYRIKKLLCELGIKKGFETCTGGFKNDVINGEWLYDIVWFIDDQDDYLCEVSLVAESEWGRTLKHIKDDFEKLLVSNSTHRLFICQAKPDQLDEFKKYFKEAVRRYPHLHKGDRFLVAILDDYNTGEFQYELIFKA